ARAFATCRRRTSLRSSATTSWTSSLPPMRTTRSEEHTSELQSLAYLVCRMMTEINTPFLKLGLKQDMNKETFGDQFMGGSVEIALFPYTTLFRSSQGVRHLQAAYLLALERYDELDELFATYEDD